jgi:hypothetical protein
MLFKLPKEKIDALFQEHGADAFSQLYALVTPDYFTDKTPLKKWPALSEQTWSYILHKFRVIDFALAFEWANGGFTKRDHVPDWMIDTTEFDEANHFIREQPVVAPEIRPCPECGNGMQEILFMGTQPDGWVCSGCHKLFPPDLNGQPRNKAIATVY